jgi:hypothetical protein
MLSPSDVPYATLRRLTRLLYVGISKYITVTGLGSGGKWALCVNTAANHSLGETTFKDTTELSMKALIFSLCLIKKLRM